MTLTREMTTLLNCRTCPIAIMTIWITDLIYIKPRYIICIFLSPFLPRPKETVKIYMNFRKNILRFKLTLWQMTFEATFYHILYLSRNKKLLLLHEKWRLVFTMKTFVNNSPPLPVDSHHYSWQLKDSLLRVYLDFHPSIQLYRATENMRDKFSFPW